MLNWRPVVDFELREIAFNRRQQQLQSESEQLRREDEQRKIVHELRMKQLRSESEQIERETEQLRIENVRLAELDARIAALWSSSKSSSTPTPPPDNASPT